LGRARTDGKNEEEEATKAKGAREWNRAGVSPAVEEIVPSSRLRSDEGVAVVPAAGAVGGEVALAGVKGRGGVVRVVADVRSVGTQQPRTPGPRPRRPAGRRRAGRASGANASVRM